MNSVEEDDILESSAAELIEVVGDPAPAGLPVRAALLHRPRPPVDAVGRGRLLATLDRGLGLPVSLVCAPAGFGKSIIVSQWVETIDRPDAWVTLDSAIDDPRWFLMHLAEAIRRVVPGALDVVSQMVQAPTLPELSVVITELSNELSDVPHPIVVVLDDYHLITSPSVHEVVSALIEHHDGAVHFVIVSRQEPPLRLRALRVRGLLGQLRMSELALDREEVQLLARQLLPRDWLDQEIHELFTATEGWPAGVRLAIEAYRLDSDSELVGVGFLDQATQDDLLAEILESVPVPVRRYLQVVSHFPSFSAELCDAAIANRVAGPATMTGSEFIDWLLRHNLFIVPLDNEGVLYRFHHLFAQLLDNWRVAHGADPQAQIQERDMRVRVAGVFRTHGMVEEAIEQLHLAGERADLVLWTAEFGNQLIEEERWAELARVLSRVPSDVVDNEPTLLLLRAWLVGEFQSRFGEMSDALDRAEALLERGNVPDPAINSSLRGQIAELRSAYEKLISADFEGAVADAEVAQELLATTPGRHLTFAIVAGVVSLAGAGRSQEAHQLASSVMGDERFAGAPFDPMAWALPYLGWLEGDLALEERHATQLLVIGERFGLVDTIAAAHYFSGTVAYERNRLDEATQHLKKVIDARYATAAANVVHSWIALSLAELAQGRGDDADVSAASMMQFVLDTHSDHLQPTAEAFLAELDLRRGRPAAALRWVHTADPDAQLHSFLFYDPMPTYVEVLMSSKPDAESGRQLLEQYLDAAQQRNHRPLTIRLLGLQALDRANQGDECGALDSLAHAIGLSQEGGIVRRVADLGPDLVPLLHRLDVAGHALAHVGAVLAAIEPETAGSVATAVTTVAGEPALTPREFDVLRLLAEHKTNQEIGRELFIAPGTVKKNTVRLYDKLNVHGRREAVAKARILGYLSD